MYFASTVANNRQLFKYDRVAHSIASVGTYPGTNSFVWDLESSNGKVYGATSGTGTAKGTVFSYDINSNSFTTLPINSCSGTFPCQGYVRGLGLGIATNFNYLFAGTGSSKYLSKTNLDDGTTTQIPMTVSGESIDGENGFISNIWYNNGYLYIAHTTSLLVMNAVSYNVVKSIPYTDPKAFDGMISSRIPDGSSALLYYRNKFTSELYAYNSSNHSLTPAATGVVLPQAGVKAFDWILDNGVYKLAMLFDNTEYALYNPQSNTLQTYQLDTESSGLDIQSLAKSPDGKLYLGGFLGGMSVYDENSPDYSYLLQASGPHQIEEIGFLNNKTYFGIYSGAKIYEYTYGGTPNLIYTVPNEQDRPYAFASGDNKLFVGTIPAYGKRGGSLSTYNGTSWSTHRNVVQDQSIIALAYKTGTLYGGTSVYGGLDSATPTPSPGTSPTPTPMPAKLFKWDVATDTKIGTEFTPSIPGMAKPQILGGFAFGPDGMLYGSAWGDLDSSQGGGTGFAIYKMDPANMDSNHTNALASVIVYKNSAVGSSWRQFYMYFGSDGFLYTTLGRYLTAFDPADLSKNTQILNVNTSLMTMGTDGSIYYTEKSRLYKLPK